MGLELKILSFKQSVTFCHVFYKIIKMEEIWGPTFGGLTNYTEDRISNKVQNTVASFWVDEKGRGQGSLSNAEF